MNRVASAGYVVTRPFPDSNVGSNLASLTGALRLARRLGRTLIVDWRGMSQLRNEELDYFTEFFEAPPEIAGVPVLYAPLSGVDYSPSAEGAAWLTPGEAREALLDPGCVEAEYLVLQAYHGPDRLEPADEHVQFERLLPVYREIRPSAEIRSAVESWAGAQLAAPFVVAVNVRTGNGRYFGTGDRYADRVDIRVFDDERGFLRLLERACKTRLRHLPKKSRDEARIFYATDSARMSELLARLPNATTRRRVFPPPGTGDTFCFDEEDYTDHQAVVDTLSDMFLLTRCDALVYNSSLFNQYARVVTNRFGGNLVHFETLVPGYRRRRVVRAIRRRL